MTQECEGLGECCNEVSEDPSSGTAMSVYHHGALPRRRRTISENDASSEHTREKRVDHHRRRVKSGDDVKLRVHDGSGGRRSQSMSWLGHQSEDRRPLLSKPIERVHLDTFAQIATCTMCNCAHSTDSSGNTSCSSHSQSYDKLNSLTTARNHHGRVNHDLTKEYEPYDEFSQIHKKLVTLQHGEVYHGVLTDSDIHYVPVRDMLHIHTPEQADMLLGDQPEKSDQVSKFDKKRKSVWRAYFGLAILLLTNTLNYMDRYTIAGVLLDVKDFYGIQNNEIGLLQTSFILSYMIFSPIFGYLGDRYSRKLLMAVGIFFWSFITLGSSFIGRESYWLFLLMRALVGIGEASYSTIAPTIIADLFVGTARTKALSVFYFAIPVGSGLGYIVGSKVAHALNNWQWALRVTPGLGLVCVFLILVIVREPQRGAADGGMHITSTSWCADLAYLLKHKSFMLSSAGFTCVAFCAGALSLWFPTYMFYSIRQKPEDANESTVSMIFGLITCASGFCGVVIGSWSASKIRHWKDSRGVLIGCKADPLVCAFGMIGCSVFLFLTLLYSRPNPIATWVLIFIGETLLSLNWALVTDMVLYIVVPTRRATAEAVQILMCHALGDAGSPYLIGQAADSITAMSGFSPYRAGQYLSLQYSMYMCCFVSVLGGGFFLAASLYITQDKANTEKAILASIPNEPSTKTDAEDTGDSPADSHQNVIT